MTALVEETVPAYADPAEAAPAAWAWSVAQWVGLLLAVGGLVDLALVWLPAHWTTPDWTFGAVAESAEMLSLPTLGVAAFVGAALARGRRALLRASGVLLLVVALLLIASYVVFLLNVPPAFKALKGQDPVAILSLRRIVARTSVTMTLLGPGLFTVGVSALRAAAARRPGTG
jgi:hypothetical protein